MHSALAHRHHPVPKQLISKQEADCRFAFERRGNPNQNPDQTPPWAYQGSANSWSCDSQDGGNYHLCENGLIIHFFQTQKDHRAIPRRYQPGHKCHGGWDGRSCRLARGLRRKNLQYWPVQLRWNHSGLGRYTALDRTQTNTNQP